MSDFEVKRLLDTETIAIRDVHCPTAADERGRSAQIFLFDVVVRRRNQQRRAVARRRDIYAITAPIIVEAAARVVDGLTDKAGAFAPGEIFDARDFLGSLCPGYLQIEFLQAARSQEAARR